MCVVLCKLCSLFSQTLLALPLVQGLVHKCVLKKSVVVQSLEMFGKSRKPHLAKTACETVSEMIHFRVELQSALYGNLYPPYSVSKQRWRNNYIKWTQHTKTLQSLPELEHFE